MNPAALIDLNTNRAKQARLGNRIGKSGFNILCISASAALLFAIILFFTGDKQFAYWLLALAITCYLPAIWWQRQPDSFEAGNDNESAINLVRPGRTLACQFFRKPLAAYS
jgi:hypothetical protein